MKRAKAESIISATGRHLYKRNYTDSGVLKKTKLKLKQSADQFANSTQWGGHKISSLQSCTITEQEADLQYSRLKCWIESLDKSAKIEMQTILFPVFISLFSRLNSSGNTIGARNFYSSNQSQFFTTPEYQAMAEEVCADTSSHLKFSLEVSQESFEALDKFLAASDHLILLHLLNTSIEVSLAETVLECADPAPSQQTRPLISSSADEAQDLLFAISRMNKLAPQAPLVKLYTIDTGQRRLCCSSVSHCEKLLASGFQDSTVAIWPTSESSSHYKVERGNVSWRPSSLENACLIGHYHPGTRRTSSPAEDQCRQSHSGAVYSTQFNSTASHLLSCGQDTTVRIWDTRSMVCDAVYRGHTYPVWATDISPTDQMFATASQDRTAKLWAFERTYPLRILAGHNADVDCVAFHPNGMYLATGSADRCVRMWSVTDGNSVRLLVGHRGTVLSVAFSPCGKLLASAGEDRRVKVWDVATNCCVNDYQGHSDVIHGVVWITGTLLASYSADGGVRVWNTQHAGPTPAAAAAAAAPVGKDDGALVASYAVPNQWKPAYLGIGRGSSLVCVAASD